MPVVAYTVGYLCKMFILFFQNIHIIPSLELTCERKLWGVFLWVQNHIYILHLALLWPVYPSGHIT